MKVISRLRRRTPDRTSSLPPPPGAVFPPTLHPTPNPPGRGRFRRFASIAAFVYLSATIMVIASERVYWYWAGFNADSVLFLGGFYLLATMAGLWALALAPGRRLHQVVLAGAIFGFVVEGVITPIIYIDGPLPIMAAMFIGWHGLLSFAGFWYLIRRWLITRRPGRLALASTIFGAVWGVWAVTSSSSDIEPEELADFGHDGQLLTPDEFTTYAFMVGATLAAAHWLIGYVWPQQWTPTRWTTRAVIAVNLAYMSVAVLLIVPWAPLKLAVLIGGAWKLLKRRPIQTKSDTGHTDDRTMIDKLAGRTKIRYLAPLALMPASAAITYAETFNHRGNDDLMSGVYWSLVVTQIVAGATAYLWAWRNARNLDVSGRDPLSPALSEVFSGRRAVGLLRRPTRSAPYKLERLGNVTGR